MLLTVFGPAPLTEFRARRSLERANAADVFKSAADESSSAGTVTPSSARGRSRGPKPTANSAPQVSPPTSEGKPVDAADDDDGEPPEKRRKKKKKKKSKSSSPPSRQVSPSRCVSPFHPLCPKTVV